MYTPSKVNNPGDRIPFSVFFSISKRKGLAIGLGQGCKKHDRQGDHEVFLEPDWARVGALVAVVSSVWVPYGVNVCLDIMGLLPRT